MHSQYETYSNWKMKSDFIKVSKNADLTDKIYFSSFKYCCFEFHRHPLKPLPWNTRILTLGIPSTLSPSIYNASKFGFLMFYADKFSFEESITI